MRGPIQIAVACDPARSDAAGRCPHAGAGRSRCGRRCGELLGAAASTATGSTAPTPPMSAAAGCATCRSRPPRDSLPRSVPPCSVRRMISTARSRADHPDRQPLPRARRQRAGRRHRRAVRRRRAPSRIRSAERCTSVAQAIRGFYSSVENVKAQTECSDAARPRQRGGVLLGAHSRFRRQRDADRHHQ